MAMNNHFLSGDPLWEACRPRVEMLASTSSSHVFAVVRQGGYPFLSSGLRSMGVEIPDSGVAHGDAFLKKRIHPDDLAVFNQYLDKLFIYLSTMPDSERSNYKYNFEFRWLDRNDKWVRVVNSLQILGFNSQGMPVELGTIDMSPDQTPNMGLKFTLQNLKTHSLVPFSLNARQDKLLTQRETEILELIARGIQSREISERLFISIHTVNRHRQNILEKLDVPNTLHAVNRARELRYF